MPVTDGEVEIAVRPGADGALTLDPWPFGAPEVMVRCEGRVLAGRFDDEDAMREALAAAPWRTVAHQLTAATSLWWRSSSGGSPWSTQWPSSRRLTARRA